jgi:hypothetical protein
MFLRRAAGSKAARCGRMLVNLEFIVRCSCPAKYGCEYCSKKQKATLFEAVAFFFSYAIMDDKKTAVEKII